MKKLFALLLAGAMVASLAACGSSSSSETTAAATEAAADTEAADTEAADTDIFAEEAEMTFAWWGNQTRTENTQAAIDAYTEMHPTVSMEGQPQQWSDYWSVLATSAAGDSLPDIIQQDYAYIEQFVADDNLLDLTPYVESGALDTSMISETIMETGMVGDGLYAICAGENAPCLCYNKTLTDSLGIEVPDSMTIDEFNEISKQIYEETGVKTNYWYGESENMLTYYVRSQGYDAFFGDTSFTWDDPSVVQGWYEWAATAMDEGWGIDPAVAAEGSSGVETNPLVYFQSEATQSWCVVSFSNMVVGYQNANQDIELAITRYPSDDQTASCYLKPSQFFSATTDSEYPDIAVDFINYLTNDEDVNVNCLKGERGIPVNSDVAAAVAASADDNGMTEMISTYINDVVAPDCSPIFPSLPSASSEVIKSVIGPTAEQVLYGQLTPEEAANQLLEKGNEILGE